MLIDILNESLLITAFVGLMMLIMEYVNVLTRGSWQEKLADTTWTQYLGAVLLGATPGCLGAFAVVGMYSHGVLSFGALVAAMIATSGDEAFVMLALFPTQALLLTGALIAIGLVAGWLTDLLAGDRLLTRTRTHNRLEIHDVDICACYAKHKIIEKLRQLSPARGILMGTMLLFLFGVLTGSVCYEEPNWVRVTVIVATLAGLFIVTTVSEHFLQEHLWHHIALKHVPRIFLWTLAALFVTQLVAGHLDLREVIQQNTLSMVVIASLVGVIPESGPHLLFTTLYDQGIVPFVVLLANSIVQDGHGMLPLLAHSRKQFILVKVINLLVGLTVAIIVYSAVCL
ncbi:MAG: putative manganese transporter [bacterium]